MARRARNEPFWPFLLVIGMVAGGLAIGRVGYERWLRFMWPLLVILAILIMVVLSIGTI